MHFTNCLVICSVLVSYLWCLETVFKTFHEVFENTDIDSPAFESETVTSITRCALLCNAGTRCLSFTVCEKGDKILCRLFDKDYWEETEIKTSRSCSYYEEEFYCDRHLEYKLRKLMAPLGISLPYNMPHALRKFSCSSLKERKPQQNYLVDTIPKLSKSWFVSFDVKGISTISGYTNIIQFTTGGNCCNDGDRIPAVWFQPGSFHPYIVSAVTAAHVDFFSPIAVPSGSFSNIMIAQHQHEAGSYIYRIFINENEVYQLENNNPREYENVKVYLGNPWSTVANAVVRNLVYSNLE